jgi:hypothetical protein
MHNIFFGKQDVRHETNQQIEAKSQELRAQHHAIISMEQQIETVSQTVQYTQEDKTTLQTLKAQKGQDAAVTQEDLDRISLQYDEFEQRHSQQWEVIRRNFLEARVGDHISTDQSSLDHRSVPQNGANGFEDASTSRLHESLNEGHSSKQGSSSGKIC